MSSLSWLRRGAADGWREQFRQELAKLDSAPGNNGNWGPKRPEPSVIGVASRILDDVRYGKLPFRAVMVIATSEGGVQIKWHDPDREFSIFIYPDQTLEFLYRNSEGQYQSGALRGTYQVNEYADRLLV